MKNKQFSSWIEWKKNGISTQRNIRHFINFHFCVIGWNKISFHLNDTSQYLYLHEFTITYLCTKIVKNRNINTIYIKKGFRRLHYMKTIVFYLLLKYSLYVIKHHHFFFFFVKFISKRVYKTRHKIYIDDQPLNHHQHHYHHHHHHQPPYIIWWCEYGFDKIMRLHEIFHKKIEEKTNKEKNLCPKMVIHISFI